MENSLDATNRYPSSRLGLCRCRPMDRRTAAAAHLVDAGSSNCALWSRPRFEGSHERSHCSTHTCANAWTSRLMRALHRERLCAQLLIAQMFNVEVDSMQTPVDVRKPCPLRGVFSTCCQCNDEHGVRSTKMPKNESSAYRSAARLIRGVSLK